MGWEIEAHLCLLHFSFPFFIFPSCALLWCVAMKLTKVLPSFTLFSSICACSIWWALPLFLLCLASVSSHAVNNKPVLVSDPFFLSPSLLLCLSTPSFIFTLYLLFPSFVAASLLSALPSFPSLCLCVTGHAVNNNGKAGSCCTPGWFTWYTESQTCPSLAQIHTHRHNQHSQALTSHPQAAFIPVS